MGLAERVAAAPADNHARSCQTCDFYNQLPDADRAAFDDWITAARPAEALRRLCEEEGLKVTESPFRNHIRNHHGKTR